MKVGIPQHDLLDVAVIVSRFPRCLGDLPTPASVKALLLADSIAPLATNDTVKQRVRDMLRCSGYKPTGRGKPSAEYLVKAVADARLASINLAVDVGNALSLHSGLPVSVLDLDLLHPPLCIAAASQDTSYVFNASGQQMSLSNLLCLFDGQGPCGNAVKDSQRTKTNERTRNTLSVIWGTVGLPGRTRRVAEWCLQLLETENVAAECIIAGE